MRKTPGGCIVSVQPPGVILIDSKRSRRVPEFPAADLPPGGQAKRLEELAVQGRKERDDQEERWSDSRQMQCCWRPRSLAQYKALSASSSRALFSCCAEAMRAS